MVCPGIFQCLQRVGAPSPKPPSRDVWSGARGDESSTLCVRGRWAFELLKVSFCKARIRKPPSFRSALGSKDSFEARLESLT